MNHIGLFDDKLKYFIVIISAKGIPYGGYSKINPLFNKWDQYKK